MPPSSSDANSTETLGALLSAIRANESRGASTSQNGTELNPTQATETTSQAQPGPSHPLSQEALERLAEKLKELIGEDIQLPGQQMLNEEGLPIVDVTEPVVDSLSNQISAATLTEPPSLRPLPKTEEERIVRRRERDAFLDALELEERLQEEKEQEEGASNDIQETEFMKAVRIARERVKEIRTGTNTQANAGISRDRDSDSAGSEQEDGDTAIKGKSANSKKVVSFADADDEELQRGGSRSKEWGDVQMAKLRKPILAKAPQMKSGSGIMQLEIVERIPPLTSRKPVSVSTRQEDSDDEDEEEKSEEDESNEENDEDPSMEDAMHHREIALRYHQLRQSLGVGPVGGALGGPIDARDAWDQENVPLDASLAPDAKSNYPAFGAPRLNERAIDAVLPQGLAGEIRQERPGDDEDDLDIGDRGKRIIEGLTKGLTVEEVLANEPAASGKVETTPDPGPPPIKSGTAVLKDVTEVSSRGNERNVKLATGSKVGKVSRFKADRLGQ